MNAQTSFERLVSQDFRHASFDDVKLFVLAVWHENFVPDVSQLYEMHAARSANYLLDKLRRFNYVPLQQARYCRKLHGISFAVFSRPKIYQNIGG